MNRALLGGLAVLAVVAGFAAAASHGNVVTLEAKVFVKIYDDLGFRPGYLWACDPAKAGSCKKSDPNSDIRREARGYCLYGSGRLIGDKKNYPVEAPDPGTTTLTKKGDAWVVGYNGFVGNAAGVTVFKTVNCLKTLPTSPPPTSPPPQPSPKPKPPPPPPLKSSGNLDIEYTVPDHLKRVGKAGLLEYHDTSSEIQPVGFRVNFTVMRKDKKECKGTLRLTVPRALTFGVTGRCEFYAIYREEGIYSVRVMLDNTGFLEKEELEGLRQFAVQDWLIVGLGDSNGSGEGAPEAPRSGFKPAKWQNRQCHRSALSYQAKTALAIEERDPQTSVTLVHLACSGATILTGMLGEYEGIEPDQGDVLPPQVDAMGNVVGDREIDAVMISIGVNDLKFGRLVVHCIKQQDCPNKTFDASEPSRPLWQEIEALFKKLPSRYADMAKRLKNAGAKRSRVYLSEYFDSTKDENGKTCDPLIPGPRGGFDRAEAQWAHDEVLVPLNAAVAKAAKRNKWKLIRGAYGRFREHGYCAFPPKLGWIVWLSESLYKQGNAEGTLHSSSVGNDAQEKYAFEALRRGLYPNGVARRPNS